MAPKYAKKSRYPAQWENPQNGFHEIYYSHSSTTFTFSHWAKKLRFLIERESKLKSEITNLLLTPCKKVNEFPVSSRDVTITRLPLGRNNSVETSLFPLRESTSRLGTRNSRTFFLRCMRHRWRTVRRETGWSRRRGTTWSCPSGPWSPPSYPASSSTSSSS